MPRWLVVLLVFIGMGCGGSDGESPAEPAAPPLPSCDDPLALALPDGSCIRPGVPLDGCAPGFEHDGEYGCAALLPPEACPPGLMAVPGETSCRPVMPCGQGRWGEIPVDATTEYVDAAYDGGASDGSEGQPWTTIAEAVTAVAHDAVVAVATGTYAEDVRISGKRVRLWGVCPDQVRIVATGGETEDCSAAAVCIAGSDASGSEVHGVALSGTGRGLRLTGAVEVLVDRVRVHDVSHMGLSVTTESGPTSLSVQGALVEQSRLAGLGISGAAVTVETSVVRHTMPSAADQRFGRGVTVQLACESTATGVVCDPAARGSLTMSGSVLEENHEIALFLEGSDVELDATVIRHTLPSATDQTKGTGVQAQNTCELVPSNGGLECDPLTRSQLVVTRSVIEANHAAGLYVAGSDASVEASVVRGTLPQVSDQSSGRGINVQVSCQATAMGDACDGDAEGSLKLIGSLVEDNFTVGVGLLGGDSAVERVVVRRTQPQVSDQLWGVGLAAQAPCVGPIEYFECDSTQQRTATITGTLVVHSHSRAISIIGIDGIVDGSVVRDTLPVGADSRFGDGVLVQGSDDMPASASLTRSRIEDSARAGVSNFASTVSLWATHVECAAFALDGEPGSGHDFSFEDAGENRCGCPIDEQRSTENECSVVSVGLTPPEPLPGEW